MRLDPAAPRTVRVAGVLTGVQGVISAINAVILLTQPDVGADIGRSGDAWFRLFLGLAGISYGVALVLGTRSARSHSIIVELILLLVAGFAIGQHGHVAYGFTIAVLCGVVLYLLMNADARDWALDRQSTVDEQTNDPDG